MGYTRNDLPASGGDFFKAKDLEGQKLRVTITDVDMQTFEGRNKDDEPVDKLVLSFKETEQRFIVNKTNAEILFDELAEDSDDWFGKKIVLFVGKTKMGPGIKVKVPEGQNAAPADDDDDEPAPPARAAKGKPAAGKKKPQPAPEIDDEDDFEE